MPTDNPPAKVALFQQKLDEILFAKYNLKVRACACTIVRAGGLRKLALQLIVKSNRPFHNHTTELLQRVLAGRRVHRQHDGAAAARRPVQHQGSYVK